MPDISHPLSSFGSSDGQEIANALSDMHIACIKQDPLLGGPPIAERVKMLRDIIWLTPKKSTHLQPNPDEAFKKLLEGLDPAQRTLLITAYAQMGHLNEIANLAARENYFLQLKNKGEFVPGGVAEFVKTGGVGHEAYGKSDAATQKIRNEISASALVEKLNQPVFEPVITSHPTNVNSRESMKAQRDIALAMNNLINREKGASPDKVMEAVKAYAGASLLNQKKNDKNEIQDANFTVRDETEMVINSLGNIYDDLPGVYKNYDEALGIKKDYKPETLKLQIRLKSWGSAGDKDGNKNVTAEKTLEAIAMHTHAILGRYMKDLGDINDPKAVALIASIKPAYEMLDKTLLPEARKLSDDGDDTRAGKQNFPAKELSDRFDKLSAGLGTLRKGLNIADFEKSLQDIYQAAQNEDKPKALNLLRKARIFGFEFAKIEYRETAEVYSEVVDVITGGEHGYKNMDNPEHRLKKLTDILKESNKESNIAAGRYQMKEIKDQIISGAQNAYSDKEKNGKPNLYYDPLPIAYHTMKRMELARDFPNMFEDNVLAECGKPKKGEEKYVNIQGAINFLEAQFVQQAAAKGGKRPLLGIVPLFEEPDTMMNIDHIMRGAYENEAYKEHLKLIADQRHGGKPTQQIQIAQSDNARRAGIPAARAFIHEAHKKMYALNEEKNIQSQFYVGGSISDAYRNGVRAISASVNAFGMHKFAKFTFQGGDTLNYFNTPFSNTRLFTRQFVHAAEKLKENVDGWVVEQDSTKVNNVFDAVAIEALKNALPDYRTQDFTSEGIGTLLAAVNYNKEIASGNVGSRNAGRTDNTSATSANAQVTDLKPVDITQVRTIGFSEAMQHNDLLPSWIGAQTLEQHLKTSVIAKLDMINKHSGSSGDVPESEKDFYLTFKDVDKNDKLSAVQLEKLYKMSPTFKDAMDKCAYGLAMTNYDRLKHRIDKVLEQVPDKPEQQVHKEHLNHYMAHLKNSYVTVGRMVHAAMKGKEFNEDEFIVRPGKKIGTEAIVAHRSITARIAAGATQPLDHLAPDIQRKSLYRAFAMVLKEHHSGELMSHDDKVLHCALDTVVHGRMLKGDDPKYKESLMSAMKKVLEDHKQAVVGHAANLQRANIGLPSHLL